MGMSKTPEELAEEHAFNIFAERYESLDSEERHVYAEAVDAFLAGYQAAAPQWISVRDRLPLDAAYVLANLRHGIEVLWYGDGRFTYDDGHELPVESCTHWMPLPKPPTE